MNCRIQTLCTHFFTFKNWFLHKLFKKTFQIWFVTPLKDNDRCTHIFCSLFSHFFEFVKKGLTNLASMVLFLKISKENDLNMITMANILLKLCAKKFTFFVTMRKTYQYSIIIKEGNKIDRKRPKVLLESSSGHSKI